MLRCPIMQTFPTLDFTPNLVLYHAACPDGFGAAWVIHRLLGDDPVYRPAVHPEPPSDEEVRGKDILMVDVCFSRQDVERIHRLARNFLIVDHHASAQRELVGLDYAYFDMRRSGAGLAWDLCFPGRPRPLLVDLVEDRDLWRNQSSQLHLLGALDSLPFDFGVWSQFQELLETSAGIEQVELEARAIDRAFQSMMDRVIVNARPVVFHGLQGWIVNAPHDMASFICARLYACEGVDFAMSWYQTAKGEASCSWRTSPTSGVDLIPLVKPYGGGGHAAAVGCRMSMSQLAAILGD